MSGEQEPPVRRFEAFKRLSPLGAGQIPIVQSLTPTECGAASLSMVLQYHGLKLPIDELRAATKSGRQGVSARSIVDAARGFGLRARAVHVDLDNIKFLPTASILHWEMNHFVVFDGVSGGAVRILDPLVGPRRIPLEKLGKSLTGVGLVFEPGPDFAAAGGARTDRMGRYIRWIGGVKGYWPRIITASVVLQLIALSMPAVTSMTVDRVVPRQDENLLHLMAAGLMMVGAFYFLSTFLRSHLLLHLRTYIDVQMSMEFLEHLLDLPYKFFQDRSTGDIVMRLNSGAQIREMLTSGAMSAVLDGTMVVVYFVLLLWAAPMLGGLALGIALLQVAIFMRVGGRHAEVMAEQLARQARLSSFQVEVIAGIESVKGMGAEQRMITRWADFYTDVLNASLDKGRLVANFGTLLSAVSFAGPIILLLAGAHLVLAGELSLGAMLGLAALGTGFLQPINTLVSTAMQLRTLRGYMERIEDILDSPTERRPDAGQGNEGPLRGDVSLSGVSFRYSADGPLVLDDVDLQVRAGQFVAVVGPSGSGKSTLARLLSGLYSPLSGQLSFDGVDMQQWDPPALRQRLGMVTQDTRLFASSIRENISLLDPEVTLERVEAVAKLAHIDAEVERLPMRYDTVLSDGGASLSGGQRQRLAIARALVHRPGVLILDEATSALDAVSERKVQQSLAALECSRIVIAHRLSTVRDADAILVLDAGRVVGFGTHTELLDGCETYRELVDAQREA